METGTGVDDPASAVEEARLAVLRSFGVLDAADRRVFDDVALMAAQICGTPMAAVTLVERDRQFFLSESGIGVRRTEREASFCAHAIQQPGRLMVVPDALADDRFVRNRLVTGDPHIRFYAGVPLVGDGAALGALCVLDRTARTLSEGQRDALQALARQTEALLAARRTATRLAETVEQLKVAAAARQEAVNRFRYLFDEIPAALTLTDAGGTFLAVNTKFAHLLGTTPDALVGLGLRDVLPAADVAAEQQILDRVAADGGRPVTRETTYRRVDGGSAETLAITHRVPRPPGEGPQLLTYLEAIGDRRAAENELLEAQSAVDAIVTIDEAGDVTAWNFGAQRMFGYTRSEVLGRPIAVIVPPDLRTPHEAGLARVAAGGEPRLIGERIEVPGLRRDGSTVWVELSLSGWTRGPRRFFTAVLRDVTERRWARTRAKLVRDAAVAANAAATVPQAATDVIAEVRTLLDWPGGRMWVRRDGRPPQVVATDFGGQARSEPPAAAPPAPRVRDLVAQVLDSGRTSDAAGVLAVPVAAGASVVGVLELHRPDGQDVDPALVADLENVGVQLGRAVEREQAAQALNHRATHDALTGLGNRRLLTEQLGAAGPDRCDGALLLLDLDRFKLVNESLGQRAGDLLLQEVAARLALSARRTDTLVRLGGDEFVVLAYDVGGAGGAERLGRRILEALREPVSVAGHEVVVGASVGVALLHPDQGSDQALEEASTALLRAKGLGRGQVQLFTDALREDSRQRLELGNALHSAVARDELLLHYQPVVDLATGRLASAEALARWHPPRRPPVPPGTFIPVAEDTGLIVPLGAWALTRACSDAGRWRREQPALADTGVSVNVSVRQLVHPGFLDTVRTALRGAGLPAGALTLEITESVLLDDDGAVRDLLLELRRTGVRLAIDDFGTGYSSVAYIGRLPVDLVKIDKSFVDPIKGPGEGVALADAVIRLTDAIGLRTVAEGVETSAQAAALAGLGCRLGQGYHFGRPVPYDDLVRPCAGDRPEGMVGTCRPRTTSEPPACPCRE